ncbi:hypothetical protein ACMSIO_01365 [Pseudomonas benzopyrenica]|uniref:hypothetical protein n=1 Tax=Pseudomonas benzopyrenica TaxID=2993566 RepID=UPI0039C40AD8
MQSAEFAIHYGGLTNADFVKALYLTLRRGQQVQPLGWIAWSEVRPASTPLWPSPNRWKIKT